MRAYSILVFGTLIACGGSTHAVQSGGGSKTATAGNHSTVESAPRLPGSAWDKPALTATPKELLALAAAAPKTDDDAGVVLYDEFDIAIDADGKIGTRWRYAYVMRSADPDALDSWRYRSDSWNTDLQEEPVIHARVIHPDGTVVSVSPSDITPGETTDNERYTQRRYRYTAPELQIGSILEEEIIHPAKKPGLAVAADARFYLGSEVPTVATRVVLSAPESLHAQPAALNLPPTAVIHTTKGGVETWTYELANLPPRTSEFAVAPDGGTVPMIGLGVAHTWGEVAKGYAALIDKVIAGDPLVFPDGMPKTPTRATAAVLTTWAVKTAGTHYVPFAYGDSVPRSARLIAATGEKSGSDLDRAVLLVAVLRQAGLAAHVALLRDGVGNDTEVELPGIGELDAVLVQARIDGKDVWIDPDYDWAPLGELPPERQNRRALVLAAETTGFVTTPASAAGDNTLVDRRDIVMSELGGATSYVETSTWTGFYAKDQRAYVGTHTPAELHDDYADYISRQYYGKLRTIEPTTPTDLDKPISIKTSSTDVGIAWVARGEIEITHTLHTLAYQIPDELLEGASTAPERRRPFEWPRPSQYTIEEHYQVPDGFVLAAPLPPDETHALGTASFQRHLAYDGKKLDLVLTFSTGKRVISAVELMVTRKAIADAIESGELDTNITLNNAAWHLAIDDKLKEALAEAQRLIATHPKLAIEQERLAYVLNLAGLNLAARRAALVGSQIGGASDTDAALMYGWTLRADEIGRMNSGAFDRKAAIAVIQKTRKVDPTSSGGALAEARVLELDDRGFRYETGADAKGALAAWKDAYRLDDTVESGTGLAAAQLRNGLYADAEQTVTTVIDVHGRSSDLDSMAAAAAMLARGPAAVTDYADGLELDREARNKLSDDTVSELKALRHYDEARMVSSVLEGPTTTRLFSQVPPPLANDKPADAATGVLAWLATGAEAKDPQQKARVWDAQTAAEIVVGQDSPGIHEWLDSAGPTATRDMALTFASPIVASAAGLWRVELTIDEHRNPFYVQLAGKTAKVVATAKTPAAVGRAVLRLAGKNEAAAEQLLDWLGGDAPTEQVLTAWVRRARNPEMAKTAGAILAGATGGAAAIAILQKCPAGDEIERECRRALVGIYRAQRKWAPMLAVAEGWLAKTGDDDDAMDAKLEAMIGLGKVADARKLLAARGGVSRHGLDVPDASLMLAAAIAAKDDAGVSEAIQAVRKGHTVSQQSAIDAVWAAIATQQDLVAAKLIAERAVGTDLDAADPAALTALAAIEAEVGDLAKARDHEYKAIARGHRALAGPIDFYVFGRIAEQLGLPRDAAELYRKVPAGAPSMIPTFGTIAARRLAALPK